MELTGLCQTVLYELIAKGVFPRVRIDQQPSPPDESAAA
jgi:hypothetical protein